MEKLKLLQMRKSLRLSQQQIAEHLNMDVSCYSKRESGLVYMKIEEWEKIAKFMNVPLNEIYEQDENQLFTCKDKASANFLGINLGTNNIYTVPETLLETQQKYIAKLEEEIKDLKRLLDKK